MEICQSVAGIGELHHVAIVVSDLQQSLTLYRDIFGYSVWADQTYSGTDIDEFTKTTGARIRMVLLQKDGLERGIVEIQEYQTADGVAIPPDRLPVNLGVYLISFIVDDIDAA